MQAVIMFKIRSLKPSKMYISPNSPEAYENMKFYAFPYCIFSCPSI